LISVLWPRAERGEAAWPRVPGAPQRPIMDAVAADRARSQRSRSSPRTPRGAQRRPSPGRLRTTAVCLWAGSHWEFPHASSRCPGWSMRTPRYFNTRAFSTLRATSIFPRPSGNGERSSDQTENRFRLIFRLFSTLAVAWDRALPWWLIRYGFFATIRMILLSPMNRANLKVARDVNAILAR
jgi:hypothetical protein